MKGNDMDWKNYKVEPEDDMFEKIAHRLRVRRAWRIGGIGAGVALLALALLLLAPMGADNNVSSVSQAAVAESPDSGIDVVEQPLVTNSEALQSMRQQTVVAEARQQQSLIVQNDAVGNDAVTVSDETDIADILPRTSLEVKPVVEQQNPPMLCTPVLLATVNDSVKPDILVETPAASPKSGQPQPEPYHEDNLIWVPNIIVPNGDIDENRYFRIVTSSPVSDFNIHIYNRGGRLLFDSNDPSFTWNATHNGIPVPQGAYVYVATFRDTDGTPRQQTGTVTVVR